jgi:hypothetical protein
MLLFCNARFEVCFPPPQGQDCLGLYTLSPGLLEERRAATETMRGDLVRGLDGAAAFVYDLSGISAVDGVTAVADRINYFSEQSLTTLMRSCGCEVTGVWQLRYGFRCREGTNGVVFGDRNLGHFAAEGIQDTIGFGTPRIQKHPR